MSTRPYDPRLMLKILIYGYTTGFRSSRCIERRCVDDVPFCWLAAGSRPDYRSIARFRRRQAGAGPQLGAVQRHLAEPHQSRRLAEPQRFVERGPITPCGGSGRRSGSVLLTGPRSAITGGEDSASGSRGKSASS